MEAALVGVIGIIILLAAMFVLGMPVGFAMGIVGFWGFSYIVSFQAGMGMVASNLWSTFSQYGMTAIPLFIFMGQIAFYSGVNEKLYTAAYKWVGHIRGGIAMATVLACAAFAAICGSNAATAATMTTVSLPEMKRCNYNSVLSTGAIACGSTLGVVIPPSVVLIVIGLFTQQSITKLFYGGIGAGLLLAVLLLVSVSVICNIHKNWGPAGDRSSLREKLRVLPGAVEMLILFLLVMLGLYFGFFTPSEAGAAGSFLALAISVIQRRLSWKGLFNSVVDTLRVSCMVMVLVAGAVIFGKFLAVTRIPFDIAEWVSSLPLSNNMIMVIIFCIYIFGGGHHGRPGPDPDHPPHFFPGGRQHGLRSPLVRGDHYRDHHPGGGDSPGGRLHLCGGRNGRGGSPQDCIQGGDLLSAGLYPLHPVVAALSGNRHLFAGHYHMRNDDGRMEYWNDGMMGRDGIKKRAED